MPLVTPARGGGHAARFHRLRVAALTRLTDTAVALDLAVPPDLADEFTYVAGQYVTIRANIAGVNVRRSYSLCTTPHVAADRQLLRIGVGRVVGGRASTWLTQEVGVGDDLLVAAPRGDFVLRTTRTTPVAHHPRHETPKVAPAPVRHAAVCVGSGVTPVLALLEEALSRGDEAALVLGNRSPNTVMFAADLDRLAARHPHTFTMRHVYSRPMAGHHLGTRLAGAHLEHMLNTIVTPAGVDHWYVCGPPAFVAETRSAIAARGAPPDTVHHEEFISPG